MSKNLIYTITTGRSGTLYLTHLLKNNLINAEVYHEKIGYQDFGINTPDLSHFTNFNSLGNTENIKNFWNQKLLRDSKSENEWYIETSHLLSKAGLMENLHILNGEVEDIHIVILKRDIYKILWSLLNILNFHSIGNAWLFALDPLYPKNIVNSIDLCEYGIIGKSLWYIYEMSSRAEYYKILLKDKPNIHFHDVNLEKIITVDGAKSFFKNLNYNITSDIVIPPKLNSANLEQFGERERIKCINLIEKCQFDPKELAKIYYDSGKRFDI